MGRHAAASVIAIAFVLVSGVAASAQDEGVEVALTVAGLVSVQPTDQAYVGNPYLDKALGGVGPGVLVGLRVRPVGHFVAAVEFSTARIEVQQSGRIVGATTGNSVPGRVHDSMLSALAGARFGRGTTTAEIVGGVSAVLDTPTSNGEPVDFADKPTTRAVLTLGLDVVRALTTHVSVDAAARAYLGVDRTEGQRQVGLGRQIYRLGAGLRLMF